MSDTPISAAKPGLGPSLVAIGCAALIALGTSALLHSRIALSAKPPDRVPLTVSTTTFTLQSSYQRSVSYLGLVIAGRKTKLGFEVPGTIARLTVRPGSRVQQGQLLAQLDQQTLKARRRAAAAELDQARAEQELAQIKAKRQRTLIATGAVSKAADDETRLRAQAIDARVEALSARLASLDIELQKSTLRAPYSGAIADRFVYQGAVISPGMPVLKLVETGAQEGHIGVAPARVGELQPGRNYPLQARGQEFNAQLLSIRPDVNPRTRTATAVFALPPGLALLDGEPLSLQLAQTVEASGGWLPLSALQEGQRGVWSVLRLQQNGQQWHAVREAVEVLDTQGDRAFVRGTINPGAKLVSQGVHRIVPGTPVILGQGG